MCKCGWWIDLTTEAEPKKKKKKQRNEFHCRLSETGRHPDDFLVTPSDDKEPDAWSNSISMRKG